MSKVKSILTFILSLFIIMFINSAYTRTKHDKRFSRASKKMYLMKTIILEDFEKQNTWVVKFSQYRKHSWKNPNLKTYEKSQKWIRWKKVSKEDYPFYAKPEPHGKTAKTTFMGVRGKFYITGYNWIVVEPKQDLYMMGRVHSISVWVWGGNYNYDLYGVIQDFTGQFYKLHFGSLKFKGWKHLEVDLTRYKGIQYDTWVPQMKPIKFVRFVIMSRVGERPNRFGIWFDDLQYISNMFEDFYYGKALEKELDWD